MDGSAHRRERIAAALLALCLHTAFLALLLHSFQQFAAQSRHRSETTLLLPRLAAPSAAPHVIDARGRPRRSRAPPKVAPQQETVLPAAPGNAAAPQPDIRSLGRSLFGCAPETYANLPAEQRARCPKPGEGLAIREAPNLMGEHSHVKDETHWQEEWARERSPALLPCLGGLNVLCLLEKIAAGKMSDFTDPRTWPRYEVKQLPPEDFRKIEDAYNAWHKAHADRPAPAQ
jgi:hypothetical protein